MSLSVSPGFGRKDVVDFLLQNGANVHARDDGGLISLHNACSFGHAEVHPRVPYPELESGDLSPETSETLQPCVFFYFFYFLFFVCVCVCVGCESAASPRGGCQRQRQLELHPAPQGSHQGQDRCVHRYKSTQMFKHLQDTELLHAHTLTHKRFHLNSNQI